MLSIWVLGLFSQEHMYQIIAAHICYLVAEANFEPYSDSARLCLIGADHWKSPRTYASPDAIQVALKFFIISFGDKRYPEWIKDLNNLLLFLVYAIFLNLECHRFLVS